MDRDVRLIDLEERFWKGLPKRVIAPYLKSLMSSSGILSSTGHEKSCVNIGRPLSKTKYYSVTDSE